MARTRVQVTKLAGGVRKGFAVVVGILLTAHLQVPTRSHANPTPHCAGSDCRPTATAHPVRCRLLLLSGEGEGGHGGHHCAIRALGMSALIGPRAAAWADASVPRRSLTGVGGWVCAGRPVAAARLRAGHAARHAAGRAPHRRLHRPPRPRPNPRPQGQLSRRVHAVHPAGPASRPPVTAASRALAKQTAAGWGSASHAAAAMAAAAPLRGLPLRRHDCARAVAAPFEHGVPRIEYDPR